MNFPLQSKNILIKLIQNPNPQTSHKRPFALSFFDTISNKEIQQISSFTSEKAALKTANKYKVQLDSGKDCHQAYMSINF